MSGQTEKRGHQLTMKGRRELLVEGVRDVDRFDEVSAVLRTTEGELTVEGDDLKIGALDTEKGIITVSGRINGMYYSSEDTGEKRSFFKRMFS